MALDDVLTTSQLLELNRQRDLAAQRASQQADIDSGSRGEGMRMVMRRIKGVTKGEALKALQTPYRFQCPPLDQFAIPHGRNFEQYSNYKGTEYISRGGQKLKVVPIRTLIVEWGAFTVERYYDLLTLKRRLARIADAGWPVELLVTHPYNDEPELHIDAVLETFTVTENANEVDARYLDLNFVEWRPQVARGKRRGPVEDWPKTATIDAHGKVTFTKLGKTVRIQDATFADLADRAYVKGQQQITARQIALAQKPPVTDYGMHARLGDLPRFKKLRGDQTGRIVLPGPRADISGFGSLINLHESV
jgi:hypothetical protein